MLRVSIEFGQMVSKYVLLNERDPDKAPKALADIVEALAAAVYIDAGGDFQVSERGHCSTTAGRESGRPCLARTRGIPSHSG